MFIVVAEGDASASDEKLMMMMMMMIVDVINIHSFYFILSISIVL